ncbi:hypothetical protein CDL60_17995 [Roseateles noduli]|nr:hypothetical protein CDL60_17995 [Roseateles noduli]
MSKLKFNAETPLYTSDGKAWHMQDFPVVMAHLVSLNRPIVVFVHGRGKEPGKSLFGATFTQGLAVHKIERGYDVSVLMFNWDSAFNGFNFLDREVPLSHTPAGGESLGRLLHQLKQFQVDKPGVRKPSLLVHSMGSIVVQCAVQNGQWPDSENLFSTVLFSQPDADDKGHSAWLDELAKREKTYLTLNADDHVLRRSTDARPDGTHALGLGTQEPLAPHAKYVDISLMGSIGKKDEDHEVFGKGAMNGQIHLCRFFTEVLLGETVVLDPTINVESVTRDVIYRLKRKAEPGAPCLKVPELPSD